MGYSEIIFIYKDGIRDAAKPGADTAAYEKAIGEAVLKVTIFPDSYDEGEGLIQVRSHQIFNHGNCVNLVDEPHSADIQAYLWHRNGLRKINELSVEELKLARNLIDQDFERRGIDPDTIE